MQFLRPLVQLFGIKDVPEYLKCKLSRVGRVGMGIDGNRSREEFVKHQTINSSHRMSALFGWQANLDTYVRQICDVYGMLARGIDKYCGGLAGKTVLEIGAAFQLPHGGLNQALAVRDGAKQVFGIDITHPCSVCTKEEKIAFWKAANISAGVKCDGTTENRVCFWSADTLHYDHFYSQIIQLQMSASNMYFKDGMFDVVFSNAVLEHVKNPRAVLSEMYRVLAPGGCGYHHWNPFSGLEMGGHDIGIPFYYPWAHLRLSEEQHVEKLATVLNDPKLLVSALPPGHTPSAERAAELAKDPRAFWRHMMDDMNQLRISDFLAYAREIGFEVIHDGYHVNDELRKYLTNQVRRELPGYSDDELLTNFHSVALRKPG